MQTRHKHFFQLELSTYSSTFVLCLCSCHCSGTYKRQSRNLLVFRPSSALGPCKFFLHSYDVVCCSRNNVQQKCSILVVTILRIVSIQRLSFLDFTYSFIEVVFWSILEPLLDVVNACLNVMLPAIQMIFTLNVFVWTRVRNFACRISILITTHHLLTLWIFLHYDQMLICKAPVLFTHRSTR